MAQSKPIPHKASKFKSAVSSKSNISNISQSNGCVSFVSLPTALLLYLCKYLGCNDLCIVIRVNTLLYTVCQHNQLWKSILFQAQLIKGNSLNNKIQSHAKEAGYYKKLWLQHVRLKEQNKMGNNQLLWKFIANLPYAIFII